MTSITTINASDLITDSRAVINTNFANLNSDKIETSVLDTDTTLAADSDSKIATQKAVKAYVDSGGQQNASETVRGLVEEATDAEVTAGTATGATGAKLFITPAKLATRLTTVLSGYQTTNVFGSGLTTKTLSDSDTTQTIAHGLGVAPKRVRFSANAAYAEDGFVLSGVFDSSGQRCIGYFQKEGDSSATNDATYTSNSVALLLYDVVNYPNEYISGTVSVDATNISIAWVKTSTPTGGWNIMWEAES